MLLPLEPLKGCAVKLYGKCKSGHLSAVPISTGRPRKKSFGAFDYGDERVFWKIDCYDRTRTTGSPNPANAGVTHRVLTIMLAFEY